MGWSLDEPFVPALSETREQFLLRGTDGDMEGAVYPDGSPPEWVPGDNSGGFTAADLREIADLLDDIHDRDEDEGDLNGRRG